ncbi:MAG: hypothetical protein AAF528_02910 [Cyanobacteria bacterium P01_C01_bin.121]
MARRKKASAVLAKAEKRLASIKSIDAKLDLCNGTTIAWYENEIASLRKEVEQYNIGFSKVDGSAHAT